MNIRLIVGPVVAFALLCGARAQAFESLINSSFTYSARLFGEIDASFSHEISGRTGIPTRTKTTNNSAAAQVDLLRSGLRADVVSVESDAVIDEMVEKTRRIEPCWKARFPNQSSPYGTTIVFVVRSGNPMGVDDWEDLRKEGVALIFADPAISIVGRYVMLNAMTHANRQYRQSEPERNAFLSTMLARRIMPGVGAMVANSSFFTKGMGDVLLTYESEALSAIEDYGGDRYQIIYPKDQIFVRFPVAIVDKVVAEKGTATLAKAYIDFLYSAEGQRIIAKHNYRPGAPHLVDAQTRSKFPPLETAEAASLAEMRLAYLPARSNATTVRDESGEKSDLDSILMQSTQ